MKSEENINLEVTQDGLRFAGIYSLKVVDKNARKRVFASLVILNSLADFFMKQNLNVSSTKSLYKASKFCEEFEITDLYVNNWRIDIRLAMPGDYFYIPKAHYENEILPDFYVVATIDKELKNPQFFGYISPKNLKTVPFNSHYYKANFDDLKEMSDMLQELKQPKNFYCKEKDHRFFHTKILSYFDNEADNFTKSKLLNHLLGCQNCRTELINFCGFDIIAQKLEDFGDLFDDESLNIIGALKAQDDEEYEDSQEESEETQQDKAEQGELIDGLFENTPKITKPITDSKPFKDIPSDKIEVLPADKERISLQEPEVLIQDIPPIEENTASAPKQEIKLERQEDKKKEEQPILTFTADDTENPQKARVSVAESLLDVLDIPDEMFNNEYEEKKPQRGHKSMVQDSASSLKKERIIVDYDEFGQPIFEEKSPEDYKIVEESADSFKKEQAQGLIVTDTFKKESSNVIEGSTETLNEELITKVPPQTKTKKKKQQYNIMIPIVGIIAIAIVAYFTHFQPSFKATPKATGEATPFSSSDFLTENSDLDDEIAKKITSKIGLVRVKKINWIAQKSLLTDENFKEYLKKVDKRFKAKFKLNSNSFTQAPYNNNVIAEIIVTPDGEIKSSRIAESSGIKELDNAIISSLHEAMNNLPVPAQTEAEQQLDEYYIKVLIKL